MISIVFDVETTGLRLPSIADATTQPHIIELGALLIDGDEIIAELSQLINPGFFISPEITKITGITNDQLAGKPTFKEFLRQLIVFFKGSDLLIAHNAPFDVGMLGHELFTAECHDFPWPSETLCTAQEYTANFGFNPSMKNLYEKMMGQPLEQKHRALDDCKDLYAILIKDEFFKKIGASV